MVLSAMTYQLSKHTAKIPVFQIHFGKFFFVVTLFCSYTHIYPIPLFFPSILYSYMFQTGLQF